MGQALATALVDSGHQTTIWNRTPGRGDVAGAVRVESAAEAVRAGGAVIVCVVDAAAAQQILETAATELPGRTVINLTGDSPDRSRELAGWVAAHQASYLDGVIMARTHSIGGPEASLLFSGPAEVWETQRPLLASLGTTTYVGEDPGRAAGYDAALLDLFWNSISGVVHGFALASAEGIAAAEFAEYAKTMTGMLPGLMDVLVEHVTAGKYPADESNLRSTVAGLEHVIHAAEAAGLEPGGLPALLETTRRAIDAGHGDEGVTRLVEVLTP